MKQTGILRDTKGPYRFAVYFDGKLVARSIELNEAYKYFRFYAALNGAPV